MITISTSKVSTYTYISNSVLQKDLSFLNCHASIKFTLPPNDSRNFPRAIPNNYLTLGSTISTSLTRCSIHTRYFKKSRVAATKKSIK